MRMIAALGGLSILVAGIVAAVSQWPEEAADAEHVQSASNVTTDSSHATDVRDPEVPDLPFEDNPDPLQCGIPVEWGLDEPAWLSGVWQGELIQPEVLLYDSHLRTSISGRAAHGSRVEVLLFQENPVLDYYLVRVPGDVPFEGWVPAPFLSFDPI